MKSPLVVLSMGLALAIASITSFAAQSAAEIAKERKELLDQVANMEPSMIRDQLRAQANHPISPAAYREEMQAKYQREQAAYQKSNAAEQPAQNAQAVKEFAARCNDLKQNIIWYKRMAPDFSTNPQAKTIIANRSKFVDWFCTHKTDAEYEAAYNALPKAKEAEFSKAHEQANALSREITVNLRAAEKRGRAAYAQQQREGVDFTEAGHQRRRVQEARQQVGGVLDQRCEAIRNSVAGMEPWIAQGQFAKAGCR